MELKPTLFLLPACLAFVSCGDPDIMLYSQAEYFTAGMEYDDAGAPLRLGAAAVCLDADPDPAVNRANMTGFIDAIAAAHPGVRLIVFGETSLGLYYRPSAPEAYQRSVAEPVPGPTTAWLAAEAAAHGIYVSFGLTEDDGGTLYNSQVLLDPGGAIASVHRKIHLTDWDIQNGFQPGEAVTFDTIDGILVATIICYDALSGDVMRALTAGRPKIVIHSLADMGDRNALNSDIIALTCNTWLISANRCGDEDGNVYAGHRSVITPIASYRARASGAEGYVYADIGVWP